jgi:hypothetical protein
LDWPGLTSFIHVEDVVSCLIDLADTPPEPGETRTFLLATESKTLAHVSQLLYAVRNLPYRVMTLPEAAWNCLRSSHTLCRRASGRLPAHVFNFLWRFDVMVNPLFHCDTAPFRKSFPELNPRLIAESIGGI